MAKKTIFVWRFVMHWDMSDNDIVRMHTRLRGLDTVVESSGVSYPTRCVFDAALGGPDSTNAYKTYASWPRQMSMFPKCKCYFPSETDGHLERSWAIFRLYLVMMLSYLISPPKPLFCIRGPA